MINAVAFGFACGMAFPCVFERDWGFATFCFVMAAINVPFMLGAA